MPSEAVEHWRTLAQAVEWDSSVQAPAMAPEQERAAESASAPARAAVVAESQRSPQHARVSRLVVPIEGVQFTVPRQTDRELERSATRLQCACKGSPDN